MKNKAGGRRTAGYDEEERLHAPRAGIAWPNGLFQNGCVNLTTHIVYIYIYIYILVHVLVLVMCYAHLYMRHWTMHDLTAFLSCIQRPAGAAITISLARSAPATIIGFTAALCRSQANSVVTMCSVDLRLNLAAPDFSKHFQGEPFMSQRAADQ